MKEKARLLVKVHTKPIAYVDIVSILWLHNGCTAIIKF